MMVKIKAFIKKEVVLCISLLCAVVTMFFVPPDMQYASYIDFRVLCLLFSLMAVVAGFKAVGAFKWLTSELLSRIKNGHILGFTSVMLVFFSSMFVTNDVALLIFVPFTIGLLNELQLKKSMIPMLVIQTVAANLGSMATPVGNPQNLFLYSNYDLSIGEFFSVTLPLTVLSFLVLGAVSFFILPKQLNQSLVSGEKISINKSLIIYLVLFVLCLFTVFKIVPYYITTVIILATVVIIDKKLFKDIDFMLLLTFVCFFVISENLGRIDAVKDFLSSLLSKNTLLSCIGASQVISNVPAAVLLSGFTEDWRSVLAGVNIGGLGTPVASLASLITLKLYMRQKNAKSLKFIAVFSLVNVVGLLMLIGFYSLIL